MTTVVLLALLVALAIFGLGVWAGLLRSRAVRLDIAGDVSRLSPKPGDVLVVRLRDNVPPSVAKQVERAATEQLGKRVGCGVVVLNDGMRLEVVTPGAQGHPGDESYLKFFTEWPKEDSSSHPALIRQVGGALRAVLARSGSMRPARHGLDDPPVSEAFPNG